MRPSEALLGLFRFFLPPAIFTLIYLYTYPVWQMCSFPPAKRASQACYKGGNRLQAAWYTSGEKAPFRLLALADPQLEGDSAISEWIEQEKLLPGFETRWEQDGLISAVREFVSKDAPIMFRGYRKRLDLWGNDLYLQLIYRTMSWWTAPTHTVVLGDLLGSQWVDDEEFTRRSDRFWGTVFSGSEKVPREVTERSGKVETLGEDEGWKKRVIAVAGNHDIGYAGDINEHRIERFEEAYGSVNWEVRFAVNDSSEPSLFADTPELRLLVLNSMNLDEPALKPDLRQQSLNFLDSTLHRDGRSSKIGTVLLTHIPLHKEEGVCTDPPFFSYFPANQGGGIKEQNHLSEATTQRILDGLRPSSHATGAIVLNGHDHQGCDTYHTRPKMLRDALAPIIDEDGRSEHQWQAGPAHLSEPDRLNTSLTGVREITVQSMMGQYGGNAGMLSAWYDEGPGEWKFDYSICILGVQHVWWGIHAVAIVETLLGVLGGIAWVVERVLKRWEVRDVAAREKKDA